MRDWINLSLYLSTQLPRATWLHSSKVFHWFSSFHSLSSELHLSLPAGFSLEISIALGLYCISIQGPIHHLTGLMTPRGYLDVGLIYVLKLAAIRGLVTVKSWKFKGSTKGSHYWSLLNLYCFVWSLAVSLLVEKLIASSDYLLY